MVIQFALNVLTVFHSMDRFVAFFYRNVVVFSFSQFDNKYKSVTKLDEFDEIIIMETMFIIFTVQLFYLTLSYRFV